MIRDHAKELADGFMLFAGWKIIVISFDTIMVRSAPLAFVAGAMLIGTVLFVDYYIRETGDAAL